MLFDGRLYFSKLVGHAPELNFYVEEGAKIGKKLPADRAGRESGGSAVAAKKIGVSGLTNSVFDALVDSESEEEEEEEEDDSKGGRGDDNDNNDDAEEGEGRRGGGGNINGKNKTTIATLEKAAAAAVAAQKKNKKNEMKGDRGKK